MRIAIVNPPPAEEDGIKFIREGRCEQRLSSFQYVMVPISLPSIAALLLAKRYEVKIWDCMAENISPKKVTKDLVRYAPELVIFNISTATFNNDIEFIAALKKSLSCHFTAIGAHASATPKETLKASQLDSVIRREPELTSLALAEAIKTKKTLAGVLGISYREGRKIINNPDRPFCQDLDSLPFPARGLLKNQKYTLPVVNQPYTLLVPSRGCPHSCVFCTASLYYGKKVRFRSVKSVMDELKEIVGRDKIKFVTMWSDTFTIKKDFVVSLCQKIIESKLDFKWMCNSRVDTIDPEMLRWVNKAGCIGISYGVESGNQTILNNVKKNITLDQIKDAFRWTREAGMETLAHVIFGLPGETQATINETIDFVIKLEPDYAQFYCAIPFPGTEFYQQAQKQNWLTTNDWSKFEINQAILDTPLLSVDQLKSARIKAYRKFYLRPAYIVQRFGKIRNLYDFALTLRQGLSFIEQWVLNYERNKKE